MRTDPLELLAPVLPVELVLGGLGRCVRGRLRGKSSKLEPGLPMSMSGGEGKSGGGLSLPLPRKIAEDGRLLELSAGRLIDDHWQLRDPAGARRAERNNRE